MNVNYDEHGPYSDRCDCPCNHAGVDRGGNCTDTYCGHCATGDRAAFSRNDHDDTHTILMAEDAHGPFPFCVTCVKASLAEVRPVRSPESGFEVLRDEELRRVGVVGDRQSD